MLAAYGLLCLIWGTTWAAIQIGLEGIPPLGGVAIRFFLAGILLWTIARARKIPLGRQRYEKSLWGINALLAFAEAAVAGDGQALSRARVAVRERLGPDELVDAAAVVANFQRMDRIADSTGIALDTPLELATGDLRERLGVGRFASAANTSAAAPMKRALGRSKSKS